jgi:hypothetical protein
MRPVTAKMVVNEVLILAVWWWTGSMFFIEVFEGD